jgi:hypothetical protein
MKAQGLETVEPILSCHGKISPYTPTKFDRTYPLQKDVFMHTLKIGRYRHFKGNEYEVIGVAKDSETLAPFVVYRALYGDTQQLWIRPATMFLEVVEKNGKRMPRFEFIE